MASMDEDAKLLPSLIGVDVYAALMTKSEIEDIRTFLWIKAQGNRHGWCIVRVQTKNLRAISESPQNIDSIPD